MSLEPILIEDEVFGKRWVYREEDVKEAVAELKKLILEVENTYPSDVFDWDNKEQMVITRGRFNKMCYVEFLFCDDDLEKGYKATRECPHFCKEENGSGACWFELFEDNGKLVVRMLHSYDTFEEVMTDER